jgi:hypothetical protein
MNLFLFEWLMMLGLLSFLELQHTHPVELPEDKNTAIGRIGSSPNRSRG